MGLMLEFGTQNYNEFKSHMRWHDYLSIIVHEFPIALVRRYDWLDEERSTFMVQFLGVKVYQKSGEMK